MPSALPWPFRSIAETTTGALLTPGDDAAFDFLNPAGEAALSTADSVSWRVFKNPVALFIGGIAAVILELAEPRIRTGVWEHSNFREQPVRRLRRTGLAAMVTVYGARSRAEAMIAEVGRLHKSVKGKTPAGQLYDASDPQLLDWVHATAGFGFLEAYDRYVAPLSPAQKDRFYREGLAAARLYGASGAPSDTAQLNDLFETVKPRLEGSDIIFDFLRIIRNAPALPGLLALAQPLFVRAAVDILPSWARDILGLDSRFGLDVWQAVLVRRAAHYADRVVIQSSPAVEACRRMGLPADFLYRR